MALIRSILHMAWMVVTVIPWTLAVLLVSWVAPRTAVWWTAVNWFRVVMWGTRVVLGVRMEVQGYEHLPVGQSSGAVLLAKHQSALETLWLPTIMPHPLAFVFKRELLKIPFFGWSMARLDMIHIDRESRAAAMKHVIEQGLRVLSHGTWVLMFPEGTRMQRGEQGTYQTAGTRLAVEAGASMPWYRYVGLDGQVIGIDRFGASAPANTLFEKYGFTADRVAEAALALVKQA